MKHRILSATILAPIVSSALAASKPLEADNDYETMSNRVLRATCNLLANPGFHQAMRKS